ncbi:MAG: GTA-gp10 family protein [Pseudomonadota bacterium]
MVWDRPWRGRRHPANPARGEVTIRLDGVERRMRLSLGALAALETRLGAGGLVALAERFEDGSVGAADLAALIAAGLAGAGEDVGEESVLAARIDGGAAAALQAGLALLARSFGQEP